MADDAAHADPVDRQEGYEWCFTLADTDVFRHGGVLARRTHYDVAGVHLVAGKNLGTVGEDSA